MRWLFVMDPLEKLHVEGDSTYAMMLACADRDIETAMCTPDQMYARDGVARARSTPAKAVAAEPWFDVGEPADVAMGDYDVIWMRKDPPFHMGYIFATYLLDLAARDTLVLNNPHGLKVFNEKIWAMHFADLQPATLLSNDMSRLRAFIADQPDGAVLKPWDGNGGRGVLKTSGDDRNLPAMVELLTRDGQDYVIAQRFVPDVARGDKRIILFDGEPIGGFLRIPTGGDHRANMHVGARVEGCELTPRDLKICSRLSPELKKHGQVFVGIDVIGDYLTEINVTSPTGFRELEALYDAQPAAELIDRVLGGLRA